MHSADKQLLQTFYNSGRFDVINVADSDILRGAELMAASRMLGLSEDETINLIQRKNAQNNRRRGTRTEDTAAAAALKSKLAQVAAINAEIPENIDELVNNLHEYRKTIKGDFAEKVETLNEFTKGLIEISETKND